MGIVILDQGLAAILLSVGVVSLSAPALAQFPPLQPLPPSNSPDLAEPEPTESPQPDSDPSPDLDPSTESPPSVLPLPTVSPRPFPQSASTIFENVTLSPAFAPDPATVRGISGGAVAANELTGRAETITGACSGFIDQQPDHRMVLTQFFNYLSLQIQSTENTTLVVRGPGGTWCNDDYAGKNPGMVGQWLSGTYEIWIGSYEQNTYHPYVIEMTEQE